MADWLVGLVLAGGWLYSGWLLIAGFRTGSMDTLRSFTIADRNDQPKIFRFNATMNVEWFAIIAALLFEIIRRSGV